MAGMPTLFRVTPTTLGLAPKHRPLGCCQTFPTRRAVTGDTFYTTTRANGGRARVHYGAGGATRALVWTAFKRRIATLPPSTSSYFPWTGHTMVSVAHPAFGVGWD